MIMALVCKFSFWPMAPIFGAGVLAAMLAIAGVVFSIVMLVDCLKRPASKFYYQLTKGAEHDRLIWAGAILLSLGFYFIGAIVYFFVVKRAKPEAGEQGQSTTTSASPESPKPEGESQKDSE